MQRVFQIAFFRNKGSKVSHRPSGNSENDPILSRFQQQSVAIQCLGFPAQIPIRM